MGRRQPWIVTAVVTGAVVFATTAPAGAAPAPTSTYTLKSYAVGSRINPSMAVDSYTHRAFMLSFSDLRAFDPATKQMTTIGGGGDALAVDEVAHQVYVLTGSSVQQIDPTLGRVRATYALPAVGGRVAVDSTTHLVFVTLPGAGRLATIVPSTGSVSSTVAPTSGPGQLGVDPVRHRVFTVDDGKGVVGVFDGRPLRRVGTLRVDRAQAVAVDPSIATVAVVDSQGAVTFVDARTLRRLGSGSTGIAFSTLAVSVDTGTHVVYTTNGLQVGGVDLRTSATVDVPDPRGPDALATDSATHTTWIGDEGSPGAPASPGLFAAVQKVTRPTTTTTLAAAPTSPTAGQPVVLTATITPVPDLGNVEFNAEGIGDVPGCGAVPVDGAGRATCSTSFPDGGSFSVAAFYSGSALYAGSSQQTTIQVRRAS